MTALRFIIVSLFLSPALPGAILTVCPSGCTTTSVNTAVGMAGAADIVELLADVNEEVVVNSPLGGLRGDIPGRKISWNGGSLGYSLELGSGMSSDLVVSNLEFDRPASNSRTIFVSSIPFSASVRFSNCVFRNTNTGASQVFLYGPSTGKADHLVLENCRFYGDSSEVAISIISAGSASQVRIQNCVFQGFNGGTQDALHYSASSALSAVKVQHCTFYQNQAAIYATGRGVFRNNTFANNVLDLDLAGSSSKADFSYNAFAVQTDTGGFGPGNLFAQVVAATEFVSAAGDNFRLLSSAKSRNAGLSLPGEVDADFELNPRPLEGAWDMGAYEFAPLTTPTPSPAYSSTPSFTFSPVYSPTPSPSPTPTQSPAPCGIVANAGAELPDAGLFAGATAHLTAWNNWQYFPDPCVTAGRSSAQARSGTWSFLIDDSACGSGFGGYYIQNVCGINTACSYQFCAWVRTTNSGSTSVYVAIEPRDAAGNAVGTVANNLDLSSVGTWTQFCATINPGSYGASFDHLRVVLGNQSGAPPASKQQAWFDDISFTGLGACAPTATATPTVSASASPSFTRTGTPSQSPSPSPSAFQSPSASPSASHSPSHSPTLTLTLTVTPSLSPSHSPTLTLTSTVTPSLSPSHSPTLTLTLTSTSSQSPSHSPSPTLTLTATPSQSPSHSPTLTLTLTATSSLSPSYSPTLTLTSTVTPSLSPSHTAFPTASATPSGTPTLSPTFSATPSLTPSLTPSSTSSLSITSSPTLSVTPTFTFSPASSSTVTATVSPSASLSPSPTFSPTTTSSMTPSSSVTPGGTASPSATATPFSSPSASPSPSPTSSPPGTATLSPTPGAWTFQLKVFDAAGNAVASLAAGTAASPVSTLTVSSEPFDPGLGPLTLSEAAWSFNWDGKDSRNDPVASGTYLLVLESTSAGFGTQSASKPLVVLRGAATPLQAFVAPNPALKGALSMDIRWQPGTAEVEIFVHNLAGEKVADLGRVLGGSKAWDFKGLPNGIYLIHVREVGQRQPRSVKAALAR